MKTIDTTPIVLANKGHGRYIWDWVLHCVDYIPKGKRRPAATINLNHNCKECAYKAALNHALSLPVGER